MFAIRIHTNGVDRVLAVCDADLLGKTFREGKKRLVVSETFYNGEIVDLEVVVERMKSAGVLNLVGNESVSLAINEGYVEMSNVITIDGIPHAQAVI